MSSCAATPQVSATTVHALQGTWAVCAPSERVATLVRVSDLVVALAGGAVGSIVTALTQQAARARIAWSEVELHDAEATERNRQLVAWTDDHTLKLARQMQAVTEDENRKGTLYSSGHGQALADAKAQALHDFRDEEWRAEIELARLRAREGAWHRLWRHLRRKPSPRLAARDEVEPFLDRWREPITRHGSQPSDAVTPLDRTKRTTKQALDELGSLNLT